MSAPAAHISSAINHYPCCENNKNSRRPLSLCVGGYASYSIVPAGTLVLILSHPLRCLLAPIALLSSYLTSYPLANIAQPQEEAASTSPIPPHISVCSSAHFLEYV